MLVDDSKKNYFPHLDLIKVQMHTFSLLYIAKHTTKAFYVPVSSSSSLYSYT